jgi:hypothetical protein
MAKEEQPARHELIKLETEAPDAILSPYLSFAPLNHAVQ